MFQTLRFPITLFLAFYGMVLWAQPCSNPIQLGSLVIQNTTCDNPQSGFIIVTVQGGNNFSYTWDPPVSTGNGAFNLTAGAYDVTVTANGAPQCTLDTTLVVTNTDGPAVLVVDLQAATCEGPNGKITLSPSNLTYTWSNGQSGPTASGLLPGCYTATATNATGCASVVQVCVPNVNMLNATATVTKPAKCGLPTGAASIAISGGSGQFTYSLGNTPTPAGLAAGQYTSIVTDVNGVCADTVTFTIPPALVTGSVNVTPYHIRCPDSTLGNVVFSVVPGQNFALPYIFSLVDITGTPFSPGSLPAGLYFLEITDADGCALPTVSFEIEAPPPFVAQPLVQGGNCAEGGRIELNPSGGNGNFIVDWLDLPGFVNPADRANLPAGYYNARVYDSLFCLYTFNQLYVPVYCTPPQVATMIVAVGQRDTVCVPPPVGQSFSNVTYSLLPPATSGQSAYGSWVLQPTGCLEYLAKTTPGFRLDSICILRQSAVPGFSDTVCVVVTITATPPVVDSVYFAVQALHPGSACGPVPASFSQVQTLLLGNAGLTGTSDAYGSYTVNPQSGCLTFFSTGPTGYNVDYIDVAVCDPSLLQCQVLTYIPTILSPTDCADGILLPADTIFATASDCQIGAEVCLPIPFEQIFDYAILDNGAPYQGSFTPCLGDTVVSYNVGLTDAGPYRLDYWSVNGTIHQGYFSDVYDFVNLINVFDPTPGWSLENNHLLIGGQSGSNYGLIQITAVTGDRDTIQPGMSAEALGTRLLLQPGVHTIVFRRLQTGCIDTAIVKVVCDQCPPFYTYVPGANGTITLPTPDCDAGAVFCTTIDQDDVVNHEIEVDGGPAPPYIGCAAGSIGFSLDTGLHVVRIRNVQTGCEEEFPVRVSCQSIPGDTTIAVADDTLTLKNTPILIPLYENDLINGLLGNGVGLSSAVLTSISGLGSAVFDPVSGLLNFTPQTDACGTARLTYQITDVVNRSSTARITIHIVCDRVLVFNGISPNGDGANDTWHIAGIEQYPKNNVQVFNRWGNRVFEQSGYANERPWDGRWEGKDLPDGAYFYLIDLGDGKEPLRGYLQLLR